MIPVTPSGRLPAWPRIAEWLRTGMALIAIGILLAGCETLPTTPTGAEAPTPTTAEAAAGRGDYVVAAHEYERLATVSPSPQKQSFQLNAADALLRAGQVQRAAELIGRVDVRGLDTVFATRKRVLQARLALAEGQNERAIRLLDDAQKTRNLSPTLLATIYLARAQAELALGNSIGAAKNFIAREQYMVDKKSIEENQLGLWTALNSMSRDEIRTALTLTRDPVLTGWLELDLAALDHGTSSAAFEQAVEKWRKRYPKHPASENFIASLSSRKHAMVGRVNQIAVLLPLNSPYRLAAETVRDGFLAMDRLNPARDKPRVKIYDIGEDPKAAPGFYDLAISEGAQLIVGPLGKEATDAIAANANLRIPALLLSHTEKADGSAMLYQFGLPPEQEARQAAERAYLDGHRQAAILFPSTPWGERMMTAFAAHWQRLGGIVLTTQAYDETQSDYSEPISQLLNIVQSTQRKDRLEAVVGERLQFEPRPRQDIDFIFVAADAKHGRLLKPQLNYHFASRVPVYSTSQIFAGKRDPIHDNDLDGVMFGDMPWMLVQDGRIEDLRATAQGNWPYAHTDLDRLYALGMDAYAIIPYLDRLSTGDATRYNGVTSGLSLEPNGRLHRQLTWARFRRGAPRLID